MLRPQFEAYVNRVWIKHCADDKQIESFKKGNTPIFQERINAIEKLDGYDHKILSKIKGEFWATFCDFTHGRLQQIILRNTKDGISYNFSPGFFENTVQASAAFSLSASVTLAKIINDEALANNVLQLYKKIYEEDDSISSA